MVTEEITDYETTEVTRMQSYCDVCDREFEEDELSPLFTSPRVSAPKVPRLPSKNELAEKHRSSGHSFFTGNTFENERQINDAFNDVYRRFNSYNTQDINVSANVIHDDVCSSCLKSIAESDTVERRNIYTSETEMSEKDPLSDRVEQYILRWLNKYQFFVSIGCIFGGLGALFTMGTVGFGFFMFGLILVIIGLISLLDHFEE